MTILELKSHSLRVPCNPLIFFLRRMLLKLLWPFFEKMLGVINQTESKQNSTSTEIQELKLELQVLKSKLESLRIQEHESLDLKALRSRLLTIESKLNV